LPVIAAKDSWNYRAGKFVQRHRASVIAAGLALVALIVGVSLILREARIARAERERADQRFNDVRKLANSLIFELHDSIMDLPGSTPARELLVSRALEYLDSLARQAKGDTSLQRESATAHERVGDVLGYT
jgi:signal transduction histidine kinase